jgi:RalA-binding protein 1
MSTFCISLVCRSHDTLLILDIEDKSARVQRLSELVHELPKVNYELLRIMSKHLKRIVRRSNENKMTIRNGKPLAETN